MRNTFPAHPKLVRQAIVMASISFLRNGIVSRGLIRLRGPSRGPSIRYDRCYWCSVTMSGARAVAEVTDKAHFRGQIEKLLSSHALHGSESLCKLLRYLVDHALAHSGAAPKEYQIATEVFGRPS